MRYPGLQTSAPILALAALAALSPHLASAQATRPESMATQPALPAEASSKPSLSEVDVVPVRELRFKGNTIFNASQLQSAAKPILDRRPNRQYSIEDLQAIATVLTHLYVDAGYINSGVVLPDQTVEGGIVTFQVIEGKLSDVRVSRRSVSAPAGATAVSNPRPAALPEHPAEGIARNPSGELHPNQEDTAAAGQSVVGAPRPGLRLLRDSYLIDRIMISAGPPLNINALKERLEILQQDPNIETINAALQPGNTMGTSVLDLTVTERQPLHLGMSFDNSRAPSVGAYRLDMLAGDTDLTGNGDSLNLRWGVLFGEIDAMRYSSLNDYSIDYGILITKYDTTFLFDYTRSNDLIVQAPFATANISSVTDEFSGTFRQPIFRTPTSELAATFSIASKSNTTTVMGRPFAFGAADSNGQTDVFVLRFGQEFSRQTVEDSISLHSTFSVGLPVANASSRSEPDRSFFSWLGQAQYVRSLPLGPPSTALAGAQAIARVNAQLTGSSLSALEQFSLGGVETVRGYEENQIVRDSGINAQLELRLPVIHASGRDFLTAVPFLDAGYGWNAPPPSQGVFLSSIGIGAVVSPNDRIVGQIYYGYAFKKFHNFGNDLQKMGIHFSLTAYLF